MADKSDPQAGIPLKNAGKPFAAASGAKDETRTTGSKDASGAWADEKATAKAKHDRAAAPSKGQPLGDALAVGGGQQSTPYQLETQADAIAKQTKRGDV